jgi:Centromere DNA-binding protein complex CBF3 subunit, domain 2
MGKWSYDAMLSSYLTFFKIDGLLGAGDWADDITSIRKSFWAERFEANVSNSMLEHVMPWLPELRQTIQELGNKATTSMKAFPELMAYLGTVLVQDALELAAQYPDHPIHQHLADSAEFRLVLVSPTLCQRMIVSMWWLATGTNQIAVWLGTRHHACLHAPNTCCN